MRPGETSTTKFSIRSHPPGDREAIYRLRYDIYSGELHQHQPNEERRLTDKLDAFNHYLGVHHEGELVGFVSITPPGHAVYSIDKYLSREQIPFEIDDQLYEIRILAVDRAYRRSYAAMLLMYAAYRYIVREGGAHVMAMGRVEVLDTYLKLGLKKVGRTITSGEVHFELMHADISELTQKARMRFGPFISRLHERCDWSTAFPDQPPSVSR